MTYCDNNLLIVVNVDTCMYCIKYALNLALSLCFCINIILNVMKLRSHFYKVYTRPVQRAVCFTRSISLHGIWRSLPSLVGWHLCVTGTMDEPGSCACKCSKYIFWVHRLETSQASWPASLMS